MSEATWSEVAERVWVGRHPWCDVNVTAIGGERGLVVVDTHGSAAAGRRVVDDVRRLGAGSVVAVVATHAHYDHCFGTAAFREAFGDDLPVHAHEGCGAELLETAARFKAAYEAEIDEAHRDDVLATEVVTPDHLFSSAAFIDLGDRALELVHPGRGHTGGDLVVRVPDVDVVLAGDLVEEAGPPGIGADAFPLEWAPTLDVLLSLTTRASLVVPGHGAVVDRAFVEEQRADLAVIAGTITHLAQSGVAVDKALEAAEWPWERELLRTAVQRGYAQLPRSERRLPMA
ncbi:MBL fold metallo-hydrolase [Nocardioides acrostichi]|uniref:MBL fold metallo-hydrolase n=1 Tax=Nocardioides acrostichi TaxID=2784339 RepID=A0A930V3L4_9ACTN|nr:MBL fold metallo-hydrolase [Nocardioides acrostichi]MBF4163379.1 MBL fold metallo-hydrolase [Nocardioides acrostichi]